MKRMTTTLIAALALLVGGGAARAQWTYVDAVGIDHPDAPAGINTHEPAPQAVPIGSLFWRYRGTGPGAVAAGTNAYEYYPIGQPTDDFGQAWTLLDGLMPGETYAIKLYGVWTTHNTVFALCYSFEFLGLPGTNWSEPIDSLTVDAATSLGWGQGWVDADDNPVEVEWPITPDTRGNVLIGTQVADTNGMITVGVRVPSGTNANGEPWNRGVYDGLAYMRVANPPVIVEASASPSVLWPPNNKMVTVHVSALVEDNSGDADWEVFAIECDQPHEANELEFVDDHTVALCARRSGNGNDRTYTLWLRATDAVGDESEPVCVQVTVSHDRGGKKR